MSEYSGEFSRDDGMFPEIRLESWNIRFESFVLQRRRKGRERLHFDAKNIFLMGFTTYNGVEQVSEVEKEDCSQRRKRYPTC